MATPSLPIRKGPPINVSPVGTTMPKGFPMPTRRSAEAFGSVDANAAYNRTSAPVTPNVPINDKDAGKGTGNVRNVTDGAHGKDVYMGGAD